MKRIICMIIAAGIVLALVSCMGNNKGAKDAIPVDKAGSAVSEATDVKTQDATVVPSETTSVIETVVSTNNGQDKQDGDKTELLQSASIDLDGDGKNEEVEALQKTVKSLEESGVDELEGILKITGGSGNIEIPFIKKQKGLSGVMSGIEFRDLDGDGSKDVFIVIPDNGAAFSLNYYFIYNYKTSKYYSHTIDSNLSEFTGGFQFVYKGKGLLEIKNTVYNFTALFDIKNDPVLDPTDENNKFFNGSWVEPTPVEINENSKLALVNAGNGISEIKVPLPVFGGATVDMIGEIDLFYRIDAQFQPVLTRFDVVDFNDDKLVKIGTYNF